MHTYTPRTYTLRLSLPGIFYLGLVLAADRIVVHDNRARRYTRRPIVSLILIVTNAKGVSPLAASDDRVLRRARGEIHRVLVLAARPFVVLSNPQ